MPSPARANTTTSLPSAAFDIVNTAPASSEAAAGVAHSPSEATTTVSNAEIPLVLDRIPRIWFLLGIVQLLSERSRTNSRSDRLSLGDKKNATVTECERTTKPEALVALGPGGTSRFRHGCGSPYLQPDR